MFACSLEKSRTYTNGTKTIANSTLTNLDDAGLDANDLVDVMQQHIVLLAHAVEHAEAGRANALDGVVEEQDANAKTIKRLKKSFKQFYTTLRCRVLVCWSPEEETKRTKQKLKINCCPDFPSVQTPQQDHCNNLRQQRLVILRHAACKHRVAEVVNAGRC